MFGIVLLAINLTLAYNYMTAIDYVAAFIVDAFSSWRFHLIRVSPHRTNGMNNAYQTQTHYSFELREREHYYLLCSGNSSRALLCGVGDGSHRAENRVPKVVSIVFSTLPNPWCAARNWQIHASAHIRVWGRVARAKVFCRIPFHFWQRPIGEREPRTNKRDARTYSLRI